MIRLLIDRALSMVVLLFVVSLVVFSLVQLVPGDPAFAFVGETASMEDVEAIRRSMGLDDPWHIRYGRWMLGVVQGDLGTSLFSSHQVSSAIAARLPITISLIAAAVVLSAAIGIPAGILAGTRPGTALDRAAIAGTSIGMAMPSFWLGLLLILFLALQAGWLPATGYVRLGDSFVGWTRHIALPAVTLAAVGAAELARQMRSGLVAVMGQDYVRTARAKGLLRRSVVGKHALKNALIPVVTVTGLQIARLFSISAIIEAIFGLPGLGSLAIQSAFRRDVPMLQGIVMVVTLMVVLANLLVDVAYGYLNPKVREA